MSAPEISSITESLRNFSLKTRNDDLRNEIDEGTATSSISDDNHIPISDTTLELNSHLALPYNWEQCLDLKTGEIYYINWKNGMKVKEDPRREQINAELHSEESCFYSEEDEEEEDSSYDSEESSSESSPSSSSIRQNTENLIHHHHHHHHQQQQDVLVVAGCKACLMYFMVPKLLPLCPKCSGHLLHFDRSGYESP